MHHSNTHTHTLTDEDRESPLGEELAACNIVQRQTIAVSRWGRALMMAMAMALVIGRGIWREGFPGGFYLPGVLLVFVFWLVKFKIV